mmetsp:Transcript_52337/g.131459  ORF Transcript_52337/g.131459 Transcript_52337/m.131459 type:complete len:602 (-) Transcript_52337:128-1933(-)
MPYPTPPKPSFFEREDVPRLPIPALRESLAIYLRKLKPLLSEKEYQQSEEAVHKFLHTEGPELQRQLVQHDLQSPTSWLEGWWDSMYLEGRYSVVVNVSPNFIFKGFPNLPTSQATVGAALIEGTVKLIHDMDAEAIKVQMERNGPLCMSQLAKIFSCNRTPGENRDTIDFFARPAVSNHVVVIHEDAYYRLQVLSADGARQMTFQDLEAALTRILSRGRAGDRPPVGLLTSWERDKWYHARNELAQANAATLADIESSMFVLCLDSASPRDSNEASRLTLHCDGTNRWFDKPIQWIVTKNCVAGMNMEHAGFDGHTSLTVLNSVYETVRGLDAHLQQPRRPSLPLSADTLRELTWDVSGGLRNKIATAKSDLLAFVQTMDLETLRFSQFGKKGIIKWKCSPDGFVQAAFQLAYYRMHGRLESTYESCMMKHFYHGRTEVIRSATQEMLEMCRLFEAQASSNEAKLKALTNAVGSHARLARECKDGKGERHLMGLKQLARWNEQRLPNCPMPEIFRDPAYTKFCTSVLSTSNCGSPCLDFFGFGPVCAQGLGLGYIIHNDALHITITSFTNKAKTYKAHLESALTDLMAVLSTKAVAKAKL